MSRLADRMMVDCQPFRASFLESPNEWRQITRESLAKEIGEKYTPDELERIVAQESQRSLANQPVATEVINPATLQGAPVFSGDDIGLYTMNLPKGIHIEDVVASMAPPFERFFIEFQKVPNDWELHAWGALITATDDATQIYNVEGDFGKPRWLLRLDTFLEKEEGKPFGPVAEHQLGLAEDGTWFRHSTGGVWWAGGLVEFDREPPMEVKAGWGDQIAQLLFPVLLTLSFLHCKNVQLQTRTPAEKLSRKYRKNMGAILCAITSWTSNPCGVFWKNTGLAQKAISGKRYIFAEGISKPSLRMPRFLAVFQGRTGGLPKYGDRRKPASP